MRIGEPGREKRGPEAGRAQEPECRELAKVKDGFVNKTKTGGFFSSFLPSTFFCASHFWEFDFYRQNSVLSPEDKELILKMNIRL